MLTLRIPVMLLCCLLTSLQAAETTAPANTSELRIGVAIAPPFTMQAEDGSWQGIAVDIWHRIAEEQGWHYQLQQMPLEQVLQETADGTLDVGLGAISMTDERERRLDFMHAYHSAGLALATRPEAGFRGWLRSFFGVQFWSAVGALTVLLLMVGFLVWLAERRRNADMFAPTLRGLGDGFWWSAVTMTTVGYGDKVPITPFGRSIGLIWMFASVITVSGFVASIASSLAVYQQQAQIEGISDLDRRPVAVIAHTTSAEFASNMGLNREPFAKLDAAIQALHAGRVDAIIYDRPLLRWFSKDDDNLIVHEQILRREDYAFVLPENSGVREGANRSLLTLLGQGEVRRIIDQYLPNSIQ